VSGNPSNRVLIDTSAWIEAMRSSGDLAVRARVERLLLDDRALFCDVVRLELWNGARGDRERRWLAELETTVATVPTSPAVWRRANALARRCREQGITVPAVDLLVAACAAEHGLDLLHRDAHFERLPSLASESIAD
jgi:predicted nucleic acid-binding protein